MKDDLVSSFLSPVSRRCQLCGGPIASNNIYGVCRQTSECWSELVRRRRAVNRENHLERNRRYRAANREKVNANRRRNAAANREKIAERQRRHYAANREKFKEYQRGYRAANREKVNEERRRYVTANREKIAERQRRHYAANREKFKEYQRGYRAANREKVNANHRRWVAAHRENVNAHKRRYHAAKRVTINERIRKRDKVLRALRGCVPMSKRREHLASGWQGGEMMYCSVPGCHRTAGWRCPGKIKKNKTGFRCRFHKGVKLPKIKEEDYEYQDSKEIRSSVA